MNFLVALLLWGTWTPRSKNSQLRRLIGAGGCELMKLVRRSMKAYAAARSTERPNFRAKWRQNAHHLWIT